MELSKENSGRILKRPKSKSLEAQVDLSIAEAHVDLRQALKGEIYLLANGDLGVCYEVPGVYDEPLTVEDLYSEVFTFVKLLRGLVPGIPAYKAEGNTVVQVILSQRETSTPPKALSLPDSACTRVLQAEERELFAHKAMTRRFLVAVRWSPARGGFLRGVKTLFNAKYTSEQQEALEQRRAFFDQELRQKEIESGLGVRRLAPEEVVAYYNSVLACGSDLPFTLKPYEDLTSLHEIVVNNDAVAYPDALKFTNGDSIRVFNWSEYPPQFTLGRFRSFIDAIPMRSFDLAWTFALGKTSTDLSFEGKKAWFARGPAHAQKFQDLNEFSAKVGSLSPYGRIAIRLLAYNLPEDETGNVIEKAVNWLGTPIVLEKQQATHFIVSSLPMNCTARGVEIPGRVRTMRLENAAAFLPIYQGPPSTNGVRWWLARNLSPTRFDLFGGQENRMMCVLGRSRAGKSCLNAQLMLEFMARFPTGIIRVVDKRSSYLKLCDIFGGHIIEFSERAMASRPYSPFSGENFDKDDLSNLVVLIQNAIVQLNPDARLSAEHTEILSEAFILAIRDQKANKEFSKGSGEQTDPHFIWPDVLAKIPVAADNKGFARAREAVEDLRRWSVALGETGQYGFLYSKHETSKAASATSPLLVYDLGGIADNKLLMMAAQLAFLKITNDLSNYPLETPKLVIFEELGVLLQGESEQTREMANSFVKNVVKTCAKLNTIAVGITNDVEDFTEKPGGVTFWSQATQKLFLPCTSKMVQTLRDNCKDLSSADIEIINDLHVKKGQYSQAYLISEPSRYKGSFNIPLSAQMDALVTTDALQVSLYNRLIKDNKSPVEAIEEMVLSHPFGRGLE